MPLVSTVRINGSALRDLRTRRGLTVAQLARKTGRRGSSIRNLEVSDGKAASLVFAHQLANALKVDPAEFTVPEDEPEASEVAA